MNFKKKKDGLFPEAYGATESRGQVSFGSLEELISPDNQIRFLDAFVDKLDLEKLQFKVKELNIEGRPPYHPKIFLKKVLYWK